jgi:hypothetical protein
VDLSALTGAATRDRLVRWDVAIDHDHSVDMLGEGCRDEQASDTSANDDCPAHV